jgi:hypothetical protein
MDERRKAGRMSEAPKLLCEGGEFSFCRLSSVRLREPAGQGIWVAFFCFVFFTIKENEGAGGHPRRFCFSILIIPTKNKRATH